VAHGGKHVAQYKGVAVKIADRLCTQPFAFVRQLIATQHAAYNTPTQTQPTHTQRTHTHTSLLIQSQPMFMNDNTDEGILDDIDHACDEGNHWSKQKNHHF
jgi:hypothetical protein